MLAKLARNAMPVFAFSKAYSNLIIKNLTRLLFLSSGTRAGSSTTLGTKTVRRHPPPALPPPPPPAPPRTPQPRRRRPLVPRPRPRHPHRRPPAERAPARPHAATAPQSASERGLTARPTSAGLPAPPAPRPRLLPRRDGKSASDPTRGASAASPRVPGPV